MYPASVPGLHSHSHLCFKYLQTHWTPRPECQVHRLKHLHLDISRDLKLSISTAEFPKQLLLQLVSVHGNSTCPVAQGNNLAVNLDPSVSLTHSLCHPVLLAQNIAKIWSLLSTASAVSLAQAPVTSPLAHVSCLLTGLPALPSSPFPMWEPEQSFPNVSHIISLFCWNPWCSYQSQAKTQVLIISYKVLHDLSASNSSPLPWEYLSNSCPTTPTPTLHPHWPPCSSLSRPDTFSPQDLCPCCALCLEWSSPKISVVSPSTLQVLLKCHLLREAIQGCTI